MNVATITRVRSRIAKHRAGRHPRSPLPPELWAEATAIAGEVGVYAASRELGVSYESLRSRLDARTSTPKQKPERQPKPVFVELDGTAPWPLGAGGPIVEVVEPSGAKLTIRLAAGALDVAQIVRAFRQEHA